MVDMPKKSTQPNHIHSIYRCKDDFALDVLQ